MIFVNQNTRAERLAICKACQFYREQTRSCGEFLPKKMMRGEFKGDVVEYRNKEITLCGCDMVQKTKFKTSKCPANKWKSVVKSADIKHLEKLVNSIDGKHKTDMSKAQEIVNAYNTAFEAKRTVKACGTCFKDLITETKEAIKNAYS
jgi:hypothetical protein